jgi:predicted nucleic acid-binding protein
MGEMTGAVFLDTSALLRYLLDGEGGAYVAKRLRSARRVIASRLIQVEARRAFLQIVCDHPEAEPQLPRWERDLENIWSKVDFLEMSREICDHASQVAPRARLRSLDAIHLATYQRALRVEPTLELLSFDRRLLTAIGR